MTDYEENEYVKNEYDSIGRVIKQKVLIPENIHLHMTMKKEKTVVKVRVEMFTQ